MVRLIATVRVAINRVRCPVAKELHFLNNMPLATRCYLHVGGFSFTIGNRKRGDCRKVLFGPET